MKLTILGCGPSTGVPIIGCECKTCSSGKPYNKRLRTSALISDRDTSILIDSGPDIRQQALTHNINKVAGIIYTHAHADHINGIDDTQKLQSSSGQINCIPVYADEYTGGILQLRSPYLFDEIINGKEWYKSFLYMQTIQNYQEFKLSGVSVLPFPQKHGAITSLGLIFNQKIAYCTDVKELPNQAYDLLYNIELLVIEALGYQETAAHAHLDLTLKWIERIKPKLALLTHMGHIIEYDETSSFVNAYVTKNKLSTEIILSHDGLCIEI